MLNIYTGRGPEGAVIWPQAAARPRLRAALDRRPRISLLPLSRMRPCSALRAPVCLRRQHTTSCRSAVLYVRCEHRSLLRGSLEPNNGIHLQDPQPEPSSPQGKQTAPSPRLGRDDPPWERGNRAASRPKHSPEPPRELRAPPASAPVNQGSRRPLRPPQPWRGSALPSGRRPGLAASGPAETPFTASRTQGEARFSGAAAGFGAGRRGHRRHPALAGRRTPRSES